MGGAVHCRLCASAMVSAGCRQLPHGVLEQLGQDVVQGQRDEGEAGGHVPVDPHPG